MDKLEGFRFKLRRLAGFADGCRSTSHIVSLKEDQGRVDTER